MPDSRTVGSSAARADQSGPISAPLKGEADPLIGRVVNGRFKIISVIARGGMGKVYRAEQAPLGRICALKVLSPKYDGDRDPEFHKRFFLEASTAAKLTHPNTVTIFDYGQSDDDIYYIAMEYIEGRTLHRVLREEGPLQEGRVAHISAQICRSLREAHSLGVVHRDLKPGNILVSDRGDERDNIKVLDFGLVKDVSGEAEDLTQAGLFMGSPKYMAPEQILGGEITPCTDVYSLGVMMYEMLSGKVPFDRGASVGTLMAHVNEVPPPIRVVNPTVVLSPAMEAVIARCLEKDPGKRFPSMKDLLLALKRVAAGDNAIFETQEGMLAARGDISAPFSRADTYSGPIVPLSTSQPPSASDPRVPAPSITDSLTGPGPAPPADTEDNFRARPKGRAYVWVFAAAVAVGITVAVVLSSKRDPTADTANTGSPATTGPTTTAAATAPAPPPSTAAAPAATVRVVRVESDPSGASVSENGIELCMSTPCDVTFKGDVAAEHKLSLNKKGYKTAKISVASSDEKIAPKLEIIQISGGGARPPSTGGATTGSGPGKAKPNPYGD